MDRRFVRNVRLAAWGNEDALQRFLDGPGEDLMDDDAARFGFTVVH